MKLARLAFGALVVTFLSLVGCSSRDTKLAPQVQSERPTPLTAAINGDLDLLENLEKSGADLNAQYPDRFNWTALMAAIYFQHSNIVANLLDQKVDIRKRDGTGNTALMWAIEFDDTNTVARLVDKFPNDLREGENWPRVAAEIRADSNPEKWYGILGQFLNDKQ